MNIKKCLEELLKDCQKEQRIFSSEADFQFALAWKIKSMHPEYDIRLEYRPWRYDKKIELDIAILKNKELVLAIELKYKTVALKDDLKKALKDVYGQEINIIDQGACDQARYDFLHDISRLVNLTNSGKYPITKSYAIFLTNDAKYWKTNYRLNTVDDAFRIHEGSSITGEKKWKAGTSEGTTGQSRKDPINIQGNFHPIHWEEYYPIPNHEFRYTIVEIKN